MTGRRFLTIHWGALFLGAAKNISIIVAFIGIPVLSFVLLAGLRPGKLKKFNIYLESHNLEVVALVVFLTAVFFATAGAIYLIYSLFGKIPVRCPDCGGRAHKMNGYGVYACSSSAYLFSTVSFDWSLPKADRCVRILKPAGIVLLAPAIAFLVTGMFSVAAPAIYFMVAGWYMASPLILFWVLLGNARIVPPMKDLPWAQKYIGYSYTYIFGTGAVLAVFRLIGRSTKLWVFLQVPDSFLIHPGWDLFFGACGLVYAFVSFSQEGLWRYRQMLAVKDIATSTVAAAAVGLVELSGTVRRMENPSGPLDSSRTILSFLWDIKGTEPYYGGGVVLGSYRKDLHPFYLDDGTGRILIDPVQEGVELRRPFISALTSFFGSRYFEVLLTGHVARHSWGKRAYALLEGDKVYVIGTAEMRENAPINAVGPERLVIRPRGEALSFRESLFQFLVPFGRKSSRTPHDVFIISDSSEQKARGLLWKNFLFSIGMPILLALISVALIIVVSR